MVYLISYDLTQGNENEYPELLAALRADGAVRGLYSEWFVDSRESAMGVASRYNAHLAENDRLFVCEVTTNSAYRNLQNEPTLTLLFQRLREAA